MPKSLVTGGAGFIGSHVADHLIHAGHDVVILDDLSGGKRENVNKSAEFIQGTILNQELVNSLFETHKFDYIFHLAAYAAEGLSHFVRNYNYSNNILGSINLINAAVRHEIKCFVYTSSIAVYGENKLPLKEAYTPNPVDPYGIAKYAVEMDLRSAHEMFGLNYVVFRPHNVYGERQNLTDPYRNVIGIFIKQTLQNAPMTMYGDGNQTRAFTHIDNVAPRIAESINIEKAYNQIFNIGSDKYNTVLQIAKMISKELQAEASFTYLPERTEVKHVHADHHKLKTYFGIENENYIDIKEGLSKMIRWAKNQSLDSTQLFEQYEINRNLPLNWKK